MKKQFFFSMLAAAALMASCSSENEVTNGGGNEVVGDGYIAVSINLPTTPSTRAGGENDQFDDGTSNEYAVSDAYLVIFTGANEASATFHSAYDLGNLEDANKELDEDDDNITTSYLKAKKVTGVTGQMWGLVMINPSAVSATITGTTGLRVGSTDLGVGTSTLKTLTELTTSSPMVTGTGSSASDFFMTNAPISKMIGGAAGTPPTLASVETLVDLGSTLYDSETLAKANPAGSIFVERGVAKATLHVTPTTGSMGVDGASTIAITGATWALANTENDSYVVRNMVGAPTSVPVFMGMTHNATPNYRATGTNLLGGTLIQPTSVYYRTYWCADPAYLSDKTYVAFSDGDLKAANASEPQYCHENTFDVAHMEYKNTTHAVIKVQFGTVDLYTVDGESKFYTQGVLEGNIKTYMITTPALNAALDAADTDDDITPSDKQEAITLTWSVDPATCKATITDITLSQATHFESTPSLAAADKAALIANLNGKYEIIKYANGYNYYYVPIKHFGNELTPWSNPTPGTTVNTTATAYTGSDDAEILNKYLGRYGMVRNNWYDIEVSGFLHPGSPTIPDLNTTTSDDNEEFDKFIAVKINILSWAKRLQSISF